ncbi:MAG: carboxypeptidase-like regulatory domain-containing protein, partial [Bacteroidales bacterium]|nr:carboxypeptidase-like regulatory domain-containing protein [Bacteroidales bacterium]
MKRLFTLILMLLSVNIFAQVRMHGNVFDNKLQPIVGALIQLENTNIVTMSSFDGEFLITAPDKYRGANLIISYAGFLTDTVEFHSSPQFNVSLAMKESQKIGSVYVTTQRR